MLVNRRQFLFIFSSIPFFRVTFTEAQSKYSETIAVLQKAYTNEIQAHLNYLSYAEKAKLENYPGLAHFFHFFATSESIHARNFKQILPALGVQAWEPLKPEIKVLSTKMNLKRALDSEMLDIDQRYPQFIEKAKPENYESALKNLNYAWETEKQHRDLILKMQSGTGMFFGILAKKIEATSFQCFLCQVCGSTVMNLPDQGCPICKNPVSAYKEVERQK